MTAFRTFFLPRQASEVELEECNKFLRSHRILGTERTYDGGGWSILVEYADRGPVEFSGGGSARIDYREILSADDFAVFAKLRDVRKALSEKDGVAAFTVATNEQLAQMVQKQVREKDMFRQIPGFGSSRIEKYGAEFLAVLVGRPLEEGQRSQGSSVSGVGERGVDVSAVAERT